MKVLVTIGSMVEKKFTRLFNIIDELCEENILNGNLVVAQIGFDAYKPKNFKAFDMIADEEFKKLIDESDLIISHAGTGTVTSCLKKGKKVIIFPRMAQYDEHYDDHQLELAEVFTRNKNVLCAKNKKELVKCIQELDSFVPSKFVSNNSKMNKLVIDFIEQG
ncbi:PssE/Cps14G family polysaccharide biosynthesis glycosyltransferase [uncultured Metabacillus sp.]|uniref:PssE/Cps14G family polysaccharide biosynthesis glycosyltransferase n=1 Tax=uncultured Metabacillus sp. TaxID=2860135 RepID=UPI0026351BCF|nr:PssE/Cps14G family polysaccharide biosynthesis glycosyltransferase [uncultured Metabacillus sp.]